MKRPTTPDRPRHRVRLMLRASAVLAAVALGLALAAPVAAQAQRGPSKREDLVEKLAGKKVRTDRATGQLREMTTDEARDFVDSIASMTDRARIEAAPVVAGATGLMKVLDDHTGHVVIARPNADGTASSRCVGNVDEAVAFLAEDALDLQ